MCQHQPGCPAAHASDHDAARVIAAHPEQGWVLLCNGIVRFDDDGELLPRRENNQRQFSANASLEPCPFVPGPEIAGVIAEVGS